MMRTLASRAVTVNDLAGEFGITRRQVYRDLAQIQEQGHPLQQSGDSRERTWQLPLGYKGLPQIAVSPYELMQEGDQVAWLTKYIEVSLKEDERLRGM